MMERFIRVNIPEEFFEHLELSIENVWKGHTKEESYDWDIKDAIGFKASKSEKGHGVVVEVMQF